MKSITALTSLSPRKRQVVSAGRANSSFQIDPLLLQHIFFAKVRLLRRARGMSQEEPADRASLDRTYISSIEPRLRNISIQNMQRLAVALQVDPRELLDPGLGCDPRYGATSA